MVFMALIWAALRFGPTRWSWPSRVRASPQRGASSRLAAAALPTSSPLKVVRGGRITGDVERLPADTERRLEELERAAIDGFDRSLIPRVEWL
jgi:hypothetical protein